MASLEFSLAVRPVSFRQGGDVQAKDISDKAFLSAIWQLQLEKAILQSQEFRFSTSGFDGSPWICVWHVQGMFPGFPEKVVAAKFRQMHKRKIIGGCTCGCRGDLQIMSPYYWPEGERKRFGQMYYQLKELRNLSHDRGEVIIGDRIVGHFEYNGTADVVCTRIFDTHQELRENWRGAVSARCVCGNQPVEVTLWSAYGNGFHWPALACLPCHAIIDRDGPFCYDDRTNISNTTDGHPFREK